MHIYIYVYIHTYIYMYRERERERVRYIHYLLRFYRPSDIKKPPKDMHKCELVLSDWADANPLESGN
jgi:hypothetical protein